MKRLINRADGIVGTSEDWANIQYNLELLEAVYTQAGPFVMSGCDLTPAGGSTYDISAGKLYLNGKVIEFPGASAVDLSAPGQMIIESASQDTESRLNDVLSTQVPGTREDQTQIVVSTTTSSSDGLYILADGMQTLEYAMKDLTIPEKTIMMWAADQTEKAAKFDSIGVGKDDMIGWVLLDGSNPGTGVNLPDLSNFLVIGAGGSFNPADTQTIEVNGSAQAYAVYFIQWAGIKRWKAGT